MNGHFALNRLIFSHLNALSPCVLVACCSHDSAKNESVKNFNKLRRFGSTGSDRAEIPRGSDSLPVVTYLLIK